MAESQTVKDGVTAAEPVLRALMARGLGGDACAYEEVLRGLTRLLRPYFRRRLGHEGEAEDLVQETLLAVHEKRHTYDRERLLTPWVFAIARFKLAGFRRGRLRRPTTALDEAMAVAEAGDQEEAGVRMDLSRLLDGLPARQRRLVEGVKLRGEAVSYMAQAEGMSEGAVKVSVHRGLRTLMLRVRDDED